MELETPPSFCESPDDGGLVEAFGKLVQQETPNISEEAARLVDAWLQNMATPSTPAQPPPH